MKRKEDYHYKYLSQNLWRICNEAYKDGAPWAIHQIYEDLQQSSSVYVIYEENNQIYGFVSYRVILNEAEISNIAVVPQFQGQNKGTMLLKQVVEDLKLKKIEKLFLEVRQSNSKAIEVYKKTGFVSTGIRKNYYHLPKEDALLMKLDLNQDVEK